MKKAYRLIKNRHSGLVQVAPETAKAHGKGKTLKVGAGATAVRPMSGAVLTCMQSGVPL